jgi:hypothetical protein
MHILKKSLLFGVIKNLDTNSEFSTFDAVLLFKLNFNSFEFEIYQSGEEIAVLNE